MLIAISKAIIEESAKCTGFSDLKKEQQEAMEHFVNFVSLPTGYVIICCSPEPESLYECIQSCMHDFCVSGSTGSIVVCISLLTSLFTFLHLVDGPGVEFLARSYCSACTLNLLK